MTNKDRIKHLEAKTAPKDEKCILVFRLRSDERVKCPKGYALSSDLRECGTCSIPEKNRTHIMVKWVGAAKA